MAQSAQLSQANSTDTPIQAQLYTPEQLSKAFQSRKAQGFNVKSTLYALGDIKITKLPSQIGIYLTVNGITNIQLAKDAKTTPENICKYRWYYSPFPCVPSGAAPAFWRVIQVLMNKYGARPEDLLPVGKLLNRVRRERKRSAPSPAELVDRLLRPASYAKRIGLTRIGVWMQIRAGKVKTLTIDGTVFIVV